MNKDKPEWLIILSFFMLFIAATFSFLIFSNVINWKNPFLKEPNSNNKTVIRRVTPTIPVRITPNIQYSSEDVRITEIKTDKTEYGSRESIIFTVLIEAKKDIGKVEINISGIKPSKTPYINETETRYLNKGENEVVIDTKTPSCTSGCGGVNPGTYTITVELYADKKILSVAETKINLVSK